MNKKLISALHIATSSISYVIQVIQAQDAHDPADIEHIAEKQSALKTIEQEIKRLEKEMKEKNQ